jgi:hypothetical protein
MHVLAYEYVHMYLGKEPPVAEMAESQYGGEEKNSTCPRNRSLIVSASMYDSFLFV